MSRYQELADELRKEFIGYSIEIRFYPVYSTYLNTLIITDDTHFLREIIDDSQTLDDAIIAVKKRIEADND